MVGMRVIPFRGARWCEEQRMLLQETRHAPVAESRARDEHPRPRGDTALPA
jgi:hypothetical protein